MNGDGESKACPPAERSEKADWAQALLDVHIDGIALISPDGTVVYANDALTRCLGHPDTDIRGKPIGCLYPPDKVGHLRTVTCRVVNTGAPARLIDRRGEQWYETLIHPLAGDEGVIDKVVMFVRDVTRQIEAEERLKLTSLQLITTQENERWRIAQDLHDDIGQHMTALLLSLRAIESGIKGDQQGIEAQIKDATHSVESMMKHVRQILYQLRPPLLATAPLSGVLESLCASLAQSTELNIDFSSDENMPPVPELQATAVYRFVQEGLNNAIKHSGATSVWVNLDCMDGEISVSLEDDGRGFNPERAGGFGFGLQGIKDRFSMLNGSFGVESAPGAGTRLYGSLPLTGYSP